MRARLLLFLTLVLFATSVFGKEVFLAVSGTANNVFFSDARIFNPNDKDITIQAYYLPRGNTSNANAQPVSFTVAKRQMKIYDDIVATLLIQGGVGGIRFVSEDEFIVTQRIYALTTTNCGASPINPCTLGQFVQGQDLTKALKKGVLLQLKSNDKFRTNVGAANPNNTTASVTWRLYDRDNALIATSPAPVQMPPYGVIGPTGIADALFYGGPVPTDKLSDAWVSFVSDQPIFAYGSVVDNGSTDQTYVPASEDIGSAPDTPTPTPKTIIINARSFVFDVTTSGAFKAGDKVTFRLSATEGAHGFQLLDEGGNTIIPATNLSSGIIEREVTLSNPGTYTFFCTNAACGIGHADMIGTFTVGEGSGGTGDRY